VALTDRVDVRMGEARALLTVVFDAERISVIRHAVARTAETVGLHDQRLEDFVLAVNEIVTNAVRHAGGHGRLKMWLHGSALRCEVADDGAGIPGDRLNGFDLPPSFAVSGRGLWLARHLCDLLTVQTGPDGTKITLCSTVR
jgi:anti-sigma regulatory factor (Ser/Thr protein kinase)